MNDQAIRVDRKGDVAWVTLARPQTHNAMDEAFIAEMTRIFADLGAAADIRAIVLAAEGKSFCAGGDLNWMRRAAEYDFAENVADARALGEMLKTINEAPKLVVARVQGAVFGGGVGLVSTCDVVIAAAGAKFCLSETKLGLVPGVISPYVLAAIGPRAARRYALTAELFDAAEAQRIGLVHIVAAETALDAAVTGILDASSGGGPQAIAGSKALMRQVAWRQIDDALMDETAARIAEARSGAEGKEGVAAFLEKRKPRWAGD